MTTAPLEIIDDDEDDDEFDWEAAVREIEVACSKANPSALNTHLAPPLCSASNCNSNSNYSLPNINNNGMPGRCKQSTIDQFIVKSGPEPPTRRVPEKIPANEFEGDERASCVEIDTEAAKTWIYPVNIPLRNYQFAITKTALFSNTLVALPTGLGKTLIAAVVMYNYFRWFPNGKIVFAAPSRPLVLQQIEACHNIVGIPQEWTIDMTGQISPTKRACFWKTKRVFFVTPQVLEKDIQAGTCMVRYLVCLVIDESHRALGNYSYCVAVRELMAVPVQLRILALTATPGAKQPVVQRIIDNLYISKLEYRNESDSDVSPYVHNRRIELIEVPLGRDAVDVNKQLLEVIRPYAARLSSLGLLQNRDYQTMSPPDLLNSRDHFRRAPPPNLPQNKYGEIEAYFGGLITLYHIRKLLSSHGIRPAYEMLEEKLKQGLFARLMGKNEAVRKIKHLMQQSLSHGAPSPKLSKMLEVLVDHFKTKDPQNSRVIIFSNFRGSVKDIMDALEDIGDLVKATEFIGQSSGKQLKGQSQKVQQAVLQKFRAGGYNVIVATSIGEEGLDIMEVDLVICFDANVSPLRMIQRMGRTGRKHDGRVVVLACEGSELKGYMRKQANSRAIRKHMHNGGINSFNFHSSPRMIPHIFKPEVQFVELSIEQYIPRGKKVKDDNAVQAYAFKEKLTSMEIASLAKYFQPTGESAWRPSLIAFPHFQAFPSRVLKVVHSSRTDMLIDAMQQLQGLSFPRDCGAFSVEDRVSSDQCCGVDFVEKESKNEKDSRVLDDSPKIAPKEASESELSPGRIKKQTEQDCIGRSPPAHSFLYNTDFVSVDALGKVQISFVPSLPFKLVTYSGCANDGELLLPKYVTENACDWKPSGQDCTEVTKQGKSTPDLLDFQTARNVTLEILSKSLSNVQQVEELGQVETTPDDPQFKGNMSNGGDCAFASLDILGNKAAIPHDESDSKLRDDDLSPRLSNMIHSGVVPESPFNHGGVFDGKGRNDYLVPEVVSTSKLCTGLLPKSPSPRKNGIIGQTTVSCDRNMSSSTNRKSWSPLVKVSNIAGTVQCNFISPIAEETSCMKKSSSEDWLVNSGDKSDGVEQVRRFKRLRKIGANGKTKNPENSEQSMLPVINLDRHFSDTSQRNDRHFSDSSPRKSKRKQNRNLMTFIEEEAEVSSEHEVSADEECEEDSSYDDSFIDDRINPTGASTQAESSRVDMLAIYRRSLLSQSPMVMESTSATFTPDSRSLMSRTNETGSSSIKSSYSLHTSQTNVLNQSTGKNLESFRNNLERTSAATPYTTTASTTQNESKLETRKRKLSFIQSDSIPAINLETRKCSKLDVVRNDSMQQGPVDSINASEELFYDDQFFASVDLDAVEEQAAFLQQKSDFSVHEHDAVPSSNQQNSPTFDLGIC